jgi:hypothetical protein
MSFQSWGQLSEQDAAAEKRRPAGPIQYVAPIGAALIVVGSILPFADGVSLEGEPVMTNGLSGAGDGLILATLALVIAALVVRGSAMESRVRTVYLASPVMAYLSVPVWLTAVRVSNNNVASWSSGDLGPGLWLTGVGVGVLVLSTTWILITNPFRAGPESSADAAAQRERLREAVAAVVGIVVGSAIGLAVAASLFPRIEFFVLYNLGLFLGGLLGARVAVLIARRLPRGEHSSRPS